MECEVATVSYMIGDVQCYGQNGFICRVGSGIQIILSLCSVCRYYVCDLDVCRWFTQLRMFVCVFYM